MKLFIDTNIFLSFYSLSNDDLEELNKLIVLIKNQELELLMPDQVHNEFSRNRDNKVLDATKKMNEHKINPNFPVFCKDYPEYNELRRLQSEYTELFSTLNKKIDNDIKNETLKADNVYRELSKVATFLKITDDIMSKSRNRIDRGDPPGKNNSLGDAINWEALHFYVPDNSDLVFISDDKDYYSPINNTKFDSFLAKEWTHKKRGKILYYRSLSAFFKDNFPNIRLADEYEKDLLIKTLSESLSFKAVHNVVARLSNYDDFSLSQTNDILSAYINNKQIYLIVGDEDVKQFILKVISSKEGSLNSDFIEILSTKFKEYDIAHTP